MKKSFFISIFLFLFLSLYAQNQSFEEQNAQSFFELNYPYASFKPDELAIDTSLIYKNLTIVNFTSPRGFVIVRTLTEQCEIVAYSYSDNFSFAVDSSGVLESLADALTVSSQVPGYNPTAIIPKLKTGKLVLEPLCQTAWGQGWPHNYYCPVDPEEDKRTLVGCVAVAVGQIIRYYDKWNNFQIQHSYVHDVYGTLSCFAGQYNWQAMDNKCYGVNNDVARLLYHSGVLVDMGYGPSSSGAQSAKAASLFNRIYDGGYLNNDPYGSQDAFYNSLSQYKPIYSTYEGHAFVCDGFDGNNFYHFNLGWGGAANGYYPLSSVLGKTLLSAIFDTSPQDSLKPPGSFRKAILSDTEVEISWSGPDGEREDLLGYTIYLDDIYFDETTDTLFLHACHPGSHYLRVSANYSSGESRWIGPASYFSKGDPNPITDNKLRLAMNTSIGVPSSQRNTHIPTKGELYDIRYLKVTNAANLSGIANCTNLRQLLLLSTRSDSEIDISELQECSDITLLRITKYVLSNPEPIGSLTKLQELKLKNNSLSNMGFLSSLQDLYKLEIIDNHFADIAFLNDLDRLTWIQLEGCNIQSFDALENTYGVEYLDISDNAVSEISWLNGNKTLRTLNADNNQLSGELNLDGFSLLRTLILSNNQIQQLHISNSPIISTIKLSDNQINNLHPIIEENKVLTDLDISGNMIDTIPSKRNILIKLDLSKNLLFDLVPIDNYRSVIDLDLQDNRIVDISPLLYKNYSGKLERINLRNNPISKESFLVHKPQISVAAGAAYFPNQFLPASPCYLQPCNDSVIMTHTVQLSWEGDYDEEGYKYDLYLRREEEGFSQIADGLTVKSFETELDESGNYSWFTIAYLEDDSLQSGYGNFKVFSGFTIPFFEDFEIYNPNERLCSQTPYWKVYGEDENSVKDAFVVNIRSYEGENSIKIAGSADLLFPISEYLNGYCEAEFRLMVDRNRQGTIQILLGDGTAVDIYFYSAGICEVYYAQTKQKFFSYQARNWMKMEIISDSGSGLRCLLDGQLIYSTDQPAALNGIRFNTLDGPGYYESAPTVMYIDNFAIGSGTLLSAPGVLTGNGFPGNLYYNGEGIILENPPSDLRLVELYNIKGQLLKSIRVYDPGSKLCHIPFNADDSLIIVVLYDDQKRRYARKIMTHRY